ncbi:hypothetical protein [Enhygromyxa salina]|nr:hypothetical protein [Enhygromyxa salina]
MAAPVLAPVLLTLGTASLARRWSQPSVEDIHRWISSEELHKVPSGADTLDRCSRLLAFDTVFSLAPTIILVVTAVLLVPAVVTAWRAGAEARLGKGSSRAAITCFLLGIAALASTRAHRADRVQVLAACTERDDPRNMHWVDASTVDLHGVEVESCSSPPAWADSHDLVLGTTFQLAANGELHQFQPGSLPHGPTFDAHRSFARDAEWYGRPGISLYVDEATPVPVLRGVLEAAREADVEAVLLLGVSTLSGEFATIGPWRRRIYCGLGVLRFDDPTRNIHEFEGFADLATAASVDGGLHLELAPP